MEDKENGSENKCTAEHNYIFINYEVSAFLFRVKIKLLIQLVTLKKINVKPVLN